MLFVIIGHDSRQGHEKRPIQRPAHLAHLEAIEREGKLALAGPFGDGSGSLVIVEAASPEEVWGMIARDPYVTNGVFESVEVRPFTKVLPRPS